MQRGFSMNSNNSLKNTKTRYPEMLFADHYYSIAEKVQIYSRWKFALQIVLMFVPIGLIMLQLFGPTI